MTISAPKDANGNTIYPTKDTLGSTEYTLNYADENGNTSVSQILASDFIQDDGSGNLILSLDDKVWSSEAHPLSHVKYLSVKVGNYGSFKEDTAASHVPDTNDTNLKLGQNESLLKVKGTVTGYLYEENEDGSVNADSKVIQDLKAEARWNSLYEEAEGSSTAAGTLMRTSQSEGYLHLDPSEPTLSMIAVKDQKKGDPDLDISYKNKNNTYYRAALGNDSDSGMSQPILRVELPLNDDAPKFETDKTKADTTIKTNAPQEEKRRGFQMTKIRLDKKLLEVAKLSEIRIYDRLETVKDEEQKDVPKSYVIDQETLKQYLDHPDADGSVTIPYDAWYHPNSADDTGVKYPAAVELVFGSFAGSVGGEGKPDEDYGHVELEGEINRYGDEQTYPQEKTQDPAKETNNLYDNSLRANASFIDYVAGTNTPIESKDQEDAKASASFFVKEPLPKLTVENQYYKGATENVVPYSREYLSVFGITNDSISRMENFRFVMTPEMGQKDDSTTGEEKNRGFHTLDMIIRNKLFEEAVFDKITIEDAAKNRRLTLKRKDFTAPTFGLLENDRNPYITLKAATEGKAEPKNVNENIVFDVTLTDLNGNPVSDVTLTTTALSRRNAMTLSDADDRTTLARGLYNVYAGDLVIPRTLLVKEAGLSEISQIIVEGSDFKAMRSDENKETARTSYSINNKQDADGAESIIFVGISDKEIKGETDQINSITDLDENGNVKAGTTTTENVGVFNAYLYSHTYDQWKDENKTLSGTQDQKDNNFAQIADDNHRRSDTQSKLLFTPKLFFDTTISAVFKDSNVGRFTDETLPMYQNLATGGTDPTYNGVGDYYIGGDRSKRPWSNKYHAPAAFYKDNLLSTLGYKSLAAYTVDFRQLGKLSYGNNSTIAKKYPYRGCNGKLQSLGTVAEDYNAAANVEMAVSLPDDSFDAYFIKLRPALKPFVNSIRVYKTDGTFYTITPESEKKGWWKDNAQDTMANGTNRGSAAAYKVSEDGNENWWRINLLTDEPSERYENDITYVDNDLNDEYEARDLVGTSSEAHKYYQTPSKVTEKGSIKAVVINMSVNRNPSAKPAEGEAATLWDAITADEGSWYKEDADPETLPGSAPYNYQYQVQNQETRHSMEIAGRVIHVGRQEAKVGARLELGSQFNMMSDTSKDPVVVRDQDKVSRIRVQRSQFYDELEEKLKKDLKDGYSDDSFAEHTEEVDGQPKASVRTLNSSAANYEKSSWSYRNWFAYETVCYNHGYWYTSESRYLDWHAAHLEDKTQIQVLNPDVRQDKGLGNTSGTDAFGKILSGYPFGTASGNVQLDYSSLLPYYGTLRGYGIGVFQAANSGTEDTRGRGWGYSDLKEDWYGRITHTDFVSMYDKLPYIGRQDGWYKGFYSRYLEMSDSIEKNLMNVEVTLKTYKQDEDGNTVNDGNPDVDESKTRTVVIPYTEIFRNKNAGEPEEINKRVLFCYAENTNGNLLGNDNRTASASNAELSNRKEGDADQPGDPLNDQILQWAGKYKNIIVLNKNEYPSDVMVRLVNLPGDGDWTDEYRGVIPDHEVQKDEKNPDWYVMGNVCDILAGVEQKVGLRADGSNAELKNTGNDASVRPAGDNGNYKEGQYAQKLANFTDGIVGFLQSRADQILDADKYKDETVTEKDDYREPVDNSLKTRALSRIQGSSFNSNFAMWYAKNIKPTGKVETNTYQPLKDVYDYGGDNTTPEKVRYRIWATNTTKKTESDEIAGLDTEGVYYNQLDYTDVIPEGLRTQKLWIPVQFISRSVGASQTKAEEAHDLEVLGENKFTVSDLTLYLVVKQNQTITDPAMLSDPNNIVSEEVANDPHAALPTNAMVTYDLKANLLESLIEADGVIGASDEKVQKYVYYADGNKVDTIDQAVFYGIDLEQMFWDKVIRSVPYTMANVDGFFQQFNVLGFKYSLKTRTDWRVDFHQNLMRYFRPNNHGDATLTGTRDENGVYSIAPADLQFEGIFVDHHFDNGTAPENTWKTGTDNHDSYKWNTHSRPTVGTDPLVLSKVVTNQVQLVMHTASLNSSTGDKYETELLDNYKKLRFVNRASKINLSVNRLPYKDNLTDIVADPDKGSPKYEPLGFNYGGNDYNKADPDTTKGNNNRTPVDVSHLLPGDRVSYYVTAVNAKDTFPTESGEERSSVTWINPVLRFEAPPGMRIARWVYMPDDFKLGEEAYVDKNGVVPAGKENETQPVSVTDPKCGTEGFTPITVDDIDAYDPDHADEDNLFYKVPENKELKDIFSNMPMERPNWFRSMIATFSAQTVARTDDPEVVRTLVWKIHGEVPVNKGLRILVVLEVEDPDYNSDSNIRNDGTNADTTALKAQVAVGGEKIHGYEPFYFTSTELQNHGDLDLKDNNDPNSIRDRRNYNYITKPNPQHKDIQGNDIQENVGAIANRDQHGSAQLPFYGDKSARQEQILTKNTVNYIRVNPVANPTQGGRADLTNLDGTHAEVTLDGMQFYTEQVAPNAKITADDAVDGENAVLTIGEPTPVDSTNTDPTKGTIRNEPYRNVAYMDLTMDFISANGDGNPVNTNYYGDKTPVQETDIRKLQGFKLNRLPNEEELSYNSLSESYAKNKVATMYVQLYDDVDKNGELTAEWKEKLDGAVAYDPDHPDKDRYARHGYRKVYPKNKVGDDAKNNEDWYYWDTETGHYEPVVPRKVVRLRLEYMSLNSRDDAKTVGTADDYLTLPKIDLYGINEWQDIYPDSVQKAYSYNYGVDIMQEWYYDSSYADNSTTIAPSDPLGEQDPDKTGEDLRKDYEEKNGITATSSTAFGPDTDSASTDIEDNTNRAGIGRRIRAQVIRRLPQADLKTETFETAAEATASNATPMLGYRLNQPLWNKVTIQNGNKADKVQPNSRNSADLKIKYEDQSKGNDTGDNLYTWNPTAVTGLTSDGLWAKEPSNIAQGVLGTGQIYRPVIIDKVPADYVDPNSNMLPSQYADDPKNLPSTPVTVEPERWKQAVTIRWFDADGNLKNPEEYNNTTLTVYKMEAEDIGGMQSFDRDTINAVGGEIAPNDSIAAKAEKKSYFVYTFTFDCKDYTAALLRGEKIEVIYKTTAKKEGLPVSTYMDKNATEEKTGKIMYAPRFGQYSYDNYYSMDSNVDKAVAPKIDDTSKKLMDMNQLLHDVGFTGKRSGQRRVYVPDGADGRKLVLDEYGKPKTYLDDTKQPKYEFMDRSKAKIPGREPGSGLVGTYGPSNNGYNDRFFDEDSDSSKVQTVTVNATLAATATENKPRELHYNNDPNTKERDWYTRLMRDRTYLLTKANAKDSEYIEKGVEKTEENPGKDWEDWRNWEENILWSEDRLHLQMAWLAGYSNILTDRYYAGDVNGDYDQYVDKTDNYLYAVDALRVYTPALQYGNEFTAKLTAINYGDWALDGVTFTYVYALGTMPKLVDNGFVSVPELPKAYYGGALGDEGKTQEIPKSKITAEIIQRPGRPAKEGAYLAPKTAMDPVQLDDYDNGKREMYPEIADELPWVVKFTVKAPLTQWWGREMDGAIKADSGDAKGYQITLNAPAVVYRQPDKEVFYDMVYTSPYDDGKDGNQNGVTEDSYKGMEADASYCQIYDDSYRSGDVSDKDHNVAGVTDWKEKNNYQQIYGMDKLYRLADQPAPSTSPLIGQIGNSWDDGRNQQSISTSNPRVYAPFTPFYIRKKLVQFYL